VITLAKAGHLGLITALTSEVLVPEPMPRCPSSVCSKRVRSIVTSTDATQTGFTGNSATFAHKSLLLTQFQMMTLCYPRVRYPCQTGTLGAERAPQHR
jgi:hypothetical protein